MPKILLLLFLFNFCKLCGQAGNVNQAVIMASFDAPYKIKPEKRRLLSFKKNSRRYNPLNYIGAGLMFAYQNIVSEQIQAECMYEVSCSEFTKCSIEKFGFIAGVLKGYNQLSECHNSAIYEHPEVFINGNKIINLSAQENK